MRIAVQASDLDNARIDGTRVYLKQLLDRFGKYAPEAEFLLYHQNEFNVELAPEMFANYRVKKCPFPVAWMQIRFAWELYKQKPDKLFLPIQAAPLFVSAKTEVTATIHDLAFKRYPETFPRKHLLKLNFLLDVVVRRADKLIAVSQSTKDDLLEFFPNLKAEKIKVIHHGFDSEFFGTRVSQVEIERILAKYQLLHTKYILYVGALQPRKNLVRLIEAFNIAKRSNPDMKLVLAGEPAWLAKSILAAQEKSAYKEDIILTGRVTFETLRILYQGARFFVFPSLYEGFGLPILEAMASRIPVLTADNSSLHEVAGQAALYCDAQSVNDIAEKLERLWSDEALQRELASRGEEQLKKFSWDKCAKETLNYIQS
ncbi:MAG: glycosyltransferase family 1 protein [bacterium]|nr:glycosyltransferase family 1 protein [bacterium]